MPDDFMKKDLWLRLRAYHFADLVPPGLWDHVTEVFGSVDASTRAFANKIARKHGWNGRFALRAINEYRKFVFLGVSGDSIVTPSRVIDIVWHEHLLFTRAYREFCRDVLRREFDHHPELLPSEQQTEVFALQFQATLERYVREFNVAPPQDIWGTPKFKRASTTVQRDARAVYSGGGDVPLYAHFDGHGDYPSHHDMPEFRVDDSGGGFSGAGGGSDWSGGHDADGSGSSGGSDGAGSDGGSGCSSGCGGGGD